LKKIKEILPTPIKKKIKRLLGIKEPENIHNIIYKEYAGKAILEEQEANDKIYQLLASKKPAMIARIGSTELRCLTNYLSINQGKASWNPSVIDEMWHASGFFSNTPPMLERFSEEFIEHLKNLDILGVWFNDGEKYTAEHICPQSDFVSLVSLEPYYHSNPWSRILEGKKVLVIHPFAESIEQQFKKREQLFEDKLVLPNFDLQTIKAVQSITGNKPPFSTWFDALEYMTEEASKRDFDIAIIGAGAYGLPLASQIKQMGKQAVHLGGATQVLFGIRGKRWDNMPEIAVFYNKYWAIPKGSEKPKDADTMEGGAYW
jgi:hypothetical protein